MSIKQFDTELRRALKRTPTALPVIAQETGLSLRWLQGYRAGHLKNPTLRSLIALWEWFNK